eukprot:TRINITY_DN27492_c0_g1_i1.p1 TRINITY_DN27492_c0_g1~~TRINITY_DN27492_c0_g1_i1.p1  ORF type:complete len:108 (+),score=14.90 TRINITY_DN27492_c0_g1_i1:76-399(+)
MAAAERISGFGGWYMCWFRSCLSSDSANGGAAVVEAIPTNSAHASRSTVAAPSGPFVPGAWDAVTYVPSPSRPLEVSDEFYQPAAAPEMSLPPKATQKPPRRLRFRT